MSNQTSAEQLVSSKFSKWKLKYARLTTYEKVIKVLTLLTTLLMLCFLTCVALNIIEIVSCETSYGNVIASEKEYQNGKFVGYKNTYLIYYDNVYDSHISSTLVNKQYNAGTSLKVYLKKQGDTLIVSEYYKTDEAANQDTSVAEVIIAKNRHGSTGTVNMGWNGKFTKFVTIDKDQGDQ